MDISKLSIAEKTKLVVFYKVIKGFYCGISAFGTILTKEDMEEVTPVKEDKKEIRQVKFPKGFLHLFVKNLSVKAKEVDLIKKHQGTYFASLTCGHKISSFLIYENGNKEPSNLDNATHIPCPYCS